MKDLYRCLDEYSLELLQAIAQVWGVSLAVTDSREAIVQLAEGMLAPEAIERALGGLSEQAKVILAEVQAAGGVVSGTRLTLSYGNIRRLGPARMARERPWIYPENPVEELFYRGLLYRAYGQIGAQYGEIYFVPQQLYDALPPLGGNALTVTKVPTPAQVEEDGNALAEDILTMLAYLRRHRVSVPDEEAPAGALPETLATISWGKRLLGEEDPRRLGLIWLLLRRLRLVQDRGGHLQPALRARDWLRLSDEQRRAQLWAVWREELSWDELRLLCGLTVQESGVYSPPMVRKRLLAVMAELPAGEWLSLDSFLHWLQVKRPDYLRGDGGLGWLIRDADSGANVTASWAEVEGRLAQAMVTTVLRWFGAVALGSNDAGQEPHAFLVTAEGRRLLSPSQGAEGQPGAAVKDSRASASVATVDDDLTVRIEVRNTFYERYQLERFAEWISQGERAVYRITPESVWRGQNAGIKGEQMVGFLRRISGDQVPLVVIGALRAWAGRFGRVTIRRAAILQAVDSRTMEQILAHQGVARLLGQAISPTMRLVDEEHIEELIRLLKEAGIWPQVRM